MCREKYKDFGPTLASEKLFERDKIKINDETLRLWFIKSHIGYRKRKKRPHRQWRQRKACLGEIVQMDGSHHDWFEGRGEPCVLMGYVDDATGRPFGKFYPYEGTLPAMASFKEYIKEYGIPISLYLDKHATYKVNRKRSIEDELNNVDSLSQFVRAVKEFGTNVIHADSPQAKGRIERLFGTFQDRLIKDMRLKCVKSIEEGNKFLGGYLLIYARRFDVEPANSTDLHRPLPKNINLDKILCKKVEHALRNDFTVAHNKKLYQIKDNIRAQKVTVEERTDGSMLICHKGVSLKFKEVQSRPEKIIKQSPCIFPKKAHVPSKDNPWRAFKINPLSAYKQKEPTRELMLV
ncbi:MAG: ISNCY family transposase [Candidatus Omnitrophota bacterium]